MCRFVATMSSRPIGTVWRDCRWAKSIAARQACAKCSTGHRNSAVPATVSAGKRRDEQAFTTCVGIVTMPTLLLTLPHVPTNADYQPQRIAVTSGNSHSFHTCGSQPEPCGDSTKPRPFLPLSL